MSKPQKSNRSHDNMSQKKALKKGSQNNMIVLSSAYIFSDTRKLSDSKLKPNLLCADCFCDICLHPRNHIGIVFIYV